MGVNDVAQANVALQFDPQQEAIRRRIDSLKAGTAANATGLNQWGETGQGAINNTYDTLDAYLGKNRTDTSTQLNAAAQQQGVGWDQAVQSGVNHQNETRSYMENLANRIGMQAALPQVMTGLENSQNQINQINTNMAQNQRGNMQNWATMMDSILGQGQNIAKNTRSSKVADFRTQLMKALAENQLTGAQGENDLQGRLLDVLSQRGNALVSEIDKLAQQEWQRQLEQAKLDQSAASANAQIGVENAKLGIQRDQMGQDNTMNIMKMLFGQKDANQQQSNWASEFGLKRDDLGYQRGQADIAAKKDDLKMLFGSAVDADPSMTPLAQQQLFSQLSNQLGLGGVPGIDNYIQQLMNQQQQEQQQKTSSGIKKRGGVEIGSLARDYSNPMSSYGGF